MHGKWCPVATVLSWVQDTSVYASMNYNCTSFAKWKTEGSWQFSSAISTPISPCHLIFSNLFGSHEYPLSCPIVNNLCHFYLKYTCWLSGSLPCQLKIPYSYGSFGFFLFLSLWFLSFLFCSDCLFLFCFIFFLLGHTTVHGYATLPASFGNSPNLPLM